MRRRMVSSVKQRAGIHTRVTVASRCDLQTRRVTPFVTRLVMVRDMARLCFSCSDVTVWPVFLGCCVTTTPPFSLGSIEHELAASIAFKLGSEVEISLSDRLTPRGI